MLQRYYTFCYPPFDSYQKTLSLQKKEVIFPQKKNILL